MLRRPLFSQMDCLWPRVSSVTVKWVVIENSRQAEARSDMFLALLNRIVIAPVHFSTFMFIHHGKNSHSIRRYFLLQNSVTCTFI